jgi:hypothetical protein
MFLLPWRIPRLPWWRCRLKINAATALARVGVPETDVHHQIEAAADVSLGDGHVGSK